MGVGGSPELQGAWKGNSPGRGRRLLTFPAPLKEEECPGHPRDQHRWAGMGSPLLGQDALPGPTKSLSLRMLPPTPCSSSPSPQGAGDKWGSLSEPALRLTCLLSTPVCAGLGLPRSMCTLPQHRDPLPRHLLCIVGRGSGS